MNIEVELRSFLTEEQHKELIEFFTKNGTFVNKDYQETHYLDTKDDLRIQKTDFYSKICLKKGALHDECREEVEVKCKTEDFESLQKLFESMGIGVMVKWFRTRHTFTWNGLTATLDDTKGFARILELEKMTSEDGKEAAVAEIKEKMKLLNVEQATKEDLQKRFQHYKENWRTLTQ